MSTEAKSAIDGLLGVLAEERSAIRALDGAAVSRAAEAKHAFCRAIVAIPPAELAPHRAAIGELRAALRRNGVLLAHARACLKEATQLVPTTRVRARM